MCVDVHVCACTHTRSLSHTHTHAPQFVCAYACVRVGPAKVVWIIKYAGACLAGVWKTELEIR